MNEESVYQIEKREEDTTFSSFLPLRNSKEHNAFQESHFWCEELGMLI